MPGWGGEADLTGLGNHFRLLNKTKRFSQKQFLGSCYTAQQIRMKRGQRQKDLVWRLALQSGCETLKGGSGKLERKGRHRISRGVS